MHISNNVPHFLSGMTELAACNTGTKTEVADTDAIVFELISEIISALGHGTNEDAATLVITKARHVVVDTDDGGISRQSNLAAIGR